MGALLLIIALSARKISEINIPVRAVLFVAIAGANRIIPANSTFSS
jgi:hypothetical protein